MFAVPILIKFFFATIYWCIRKIITHFFYRKDERTLKMVLRFTTGIGFYKIVSNKLKRGRLFNFFIIYSNEKDFIFFSKNFTFILTFLVHILLFWWFLVYKIDFHSLAFYQTVLYSLVFSVGYLFLNIGANYAFERCERDLNFKAFVEGIESLNNRERGNLSQTNEFQFG